MTYSPKGSKDKLTVCCPESVSILKLNLNKIALELCILTLVLLNPDIPCLCKQYRSRSVGFLASKKPADLDLDCLPFSMWIYINNLDQVIWLAENLKRAWHLIFFSGTKVNHENSKTNLHLYSKLSVGSLVVLIWIPLVLLWGMTWTLAL